MLLKRNGFIFLCLISLVFSACVKKTEEESSSVGNPVDRKEMFTYLADEVIIPAFDTFDVKLDTLVSKSDKFVSNPSQTTLTNLRTAWREAYIEWQRVELFDVYPSQNAQLRRYFNIYPVSESKIETNVHSTGTVNLGTVDNEDVLGFPALDYLINGLAATDQEIIDHYTIASDSAQRVIYFKRILSEMNARFDQAHAAWKGSYRTTFINQTGMDKESTLGVLTSAYIKNYEAFIRAGKIGIPGGITPVGDVTAAPAKVEAVYTKSLSLILVKTANTASKDFFNGKSRLTGLEGPSYKTYSDAVGVKDGVTGNLLSTVVNQQFVIIDNNLNTLTPDLFTQIGTDRTKVKVVYNDMQKIVRLLKTDMVSKLSIMLNYLDTDGD